jgi:hypothetical protein
VSPGLELDLSLFDPMGRNALHEGVDQPVQFTRDLGEVDWPG